MCEGRIRLLDRKLPHLRFYCDEMADSAKDVRRTKVKTPLISTN